MEVSVVKWVGTTKLSIYLPRGVPGDGPPQPQLSTSLASIHHIRPMLLELLLLQGTAMSMNLVGESILLRATIGMLA